MNVQYGNNDKNGNYYSNNTSSNKGLKLSIIFIGPPFLIKNLSDLLKTYQRWMIKALPVSGSFFTCFGIAISNIKSSLLSISF